MKKAIILLTLLAMIQSGCTSSKKATIPFNRSVETPDTFTIIWNGVSKAYRYDKGQWVRTENYDYQFDVVQKRFSNQWKSVKSLHRIHPDYDGKAGDRDQTMYFELDYSRSADEKVQALIRSSLGQGHGTTDNEFRASTLTINVADPSRFMPYNKYRITQQYQYEKGLLTETVELIYEKDGRETFFMKNEETASIFIRSNLDKAPTRLGE